MPLSRSGIRSGMDAEEIWIEPFVEDRLAATGYDLGLSDAVYRMIEIGRPVNPLNRETLDGFVAEDDVDGEIRLEPGQPVSIPSRETIALAPSLYGTIHATPSLGKLGVSLQIDGGILDAGFGSDAPQPVVFTLVSHNPNPVVLQPGQSVACLRFHPIDDQPAEPAKTPSASPRPAFVNIVAELSDEPFLVGVTGLPLVGKSAVAAIVADLLDAETYSLGSVVRQEAADRGYPEPTNDQLKEVSESLRDERGQDAVAELLVKDLEDRSLDRPVVLEGIRGVGEIETFKEELSAPFVTIGVHASERTRLERVRRGRPERSDDEPTMEYLRSRDEKEASFGIREAITRSDFIITNEGSLADLERDVERVLARLLAEYV